MKTRPSRPTRARPCHGPTRACHAAPLHTCHPWGVGSLRLARLAMQARVFRRCWWAQTTHSSGLRANSIDGDPYSALLIARIATAHDRTREKGAGGEESVPLARSECPDTLQVVHIVSLPSVTFRCISPPYFQSALQSIACHSWAKDSVTVLKGEPSHAHPEGYIAPSEPSPEPTQPTARLGHHPPAPTGR